MRRRLFRQLSRWGRWRSSPPPARSSRARSARGGRLQGRHRLLAHRPARRLRRRVRPGPAVRHPVRDRRHRQGQRQDHHPLARRRQDRSCHRRLGDEGPHRPGLQDHRRRRLSGVALQEAPIAAQNQVLFISGPAASDAITGLNRYTFRSGRQTYQDVADGGDLPARAAARTSSSSRRTRRSARATSPPSSRSSAARATTSRRSTSRYGDRLHAVRPAGKQAKPDLLYVAWAGATAAQMWSALDQQGVFSTVDRSSPVSPSGRPSRVTARGREDPASCPTTSTRHRTTR